MGGKSSKNSEMKVDKVVPLNDFSEVSAEVQVEQTHQVDPTC